MEPMKFFYAPGSCATASHVILEEVGAAFEPILVRFELNEQNSEEYRKINPRGRVAALIVDGEILTEEPAILTYLARRYPDHDLLPTEPLPLGQCMAFMSFVASTVHVAVAQVHRPFRFVRDASEHGSLKETGRDIFWASMQDLDARLGDKPWVAGERFTVCDPYLLVCYRWAYKTDLPIADLRNLTRHKDQMQARPSVQRVYAREGTKPL